MQDLPAWKPCCDLAKRLLAAMCSTISSRMSCSKSFPGTCTEVKLIGLYFVGFDLEPDLQIADLHVLFCHISGILPFSTDF